MNRALLILISLIGFSSAQIRSQFIKMLTPRPYHAGDTIKFCAICTNNIPAESLFISTNLFSPATKPAPVIFSESKSITITNPDTSWMYLLTHSSEHCDTISFVAYYAPFTNDSLFYIKFKMVGYDISELTFKNTAETYKESIKPAHKTILKHSPNPNFVNLLGRKFEMNNKSQMLTPKKGVVTIGN